VPATTPGGKVAIQATKSYARQKQRPIPDLPIFLKKEKIGIEGYFLLDMGPLICADANG